MPSSTSPDITKKCHLSLTGLALAGDPFLNRVSAGRLSFPPPLLGQIGKVLCTNITHELTRHILVGVMRRKSAFLLNPPRIRIAVVVSAPQTAQPKILESMALEKRGACEKLETKFFMPKRQFDA